MVIDSRHFVEKGLNLRKNKQYWGPLWSWDFNLEMQKSEARVTVLRK